MKEYLNPNCQKFIGNTWPTLSVICKICLQETKLLLIPCVLLITLTNT